MLASITGIGWFGPAGAGQGRKDTFRLCDGQVSTISRPSVFSKPYLHFGRMDLYSRLGVAAVALSLQDANLEDWKERRAFGLISSTLYGCLATDIDFYDTVRDREGGFGSPQLFAYTLSSTFVGEAAIRFGLTGPIYTINEQPLSGLEALRAALQSISLGEADTVIAGICDFGRPDRFPGQDSMSGALFMVLQKTPTKEIVPYGEFDLAGNQVLLGRRKIKSLFAAAEMCTTRAKQ